ncbi:bifunctional diaminohydroxyphosphoribosylaminopyrimidine deaminase/5-amino-6-(5-phosphoribosylamino)uracil reductase RibD [Acidiphilium sp.]|uniref:bifunctional diaminohydroxyphosphoribosylaminopyrimidine deaminase/5-amino-6-(5-phosphoribosylamino)uracil reductase RibD n=1 Tax=Acidiphilium sp. TaxID=527 RepID=UPI00258FD88B|nr:bifunctional diaminohydroxyphosphoribosylaminopyrimidine deaminase/5-amino-6-(5-phosphoribosylamino)uracil reductase RibD [Acidiphilium sp.]
MDDLAHMRTALALARRGLGETAPNPTVGCVIVRGGRVVGRGRTAQGGRPHAETEALAAAGDAARGATAYVTLEPCAHHGRTPPCADALVAAGIARVVVAMTDPDERTNGAGLSRLREAGLEVVEGIGGAEAAEINAGFCKCIREGRPLVTLKLATSLDGQIATRTGASQWITGAAARQAAHALRGTHDAVMVGVGTVLADDPELTCRLEGFRSTPVIRLIVDSHLRIPLDGRLVRGAADHPLWIVHRDGADPARRAALLDLGARLFEVPAAPVGIDLAAALAVVGAAGLTRVLAEGGGTLAAALIRADLVDRLEWFTAPVVIGDDGIGAVAGFGVEELGRAARFTRIDASVCGGDIRTRYRRD